MTAATEELDVPEIAGGPIPQDMVYEVAADAVIKKGWIVALNSSGYADAASTAVGLKCLGIAQEDVDNTDGDDGDLTVRVRRGVFPAVNNAGDELDQNDIHKTAWLVDNQTVGESPTGRSPAGRFEGFDEDGNPLVSFGVRESTADDLPSAAAGIQTGTATLVGGTKTVNTGVRLTAKSKIFLTLNTPGGTLGANHKVPDASITTGEAGTAEFTITAVDSAGALVNTDTSSLNWLVIG